MIHTILTGSYDGVSYVTWIIVSAIYLLEYIFVACSFYTIAHKRGIKYPGFAWVPILQYWTIGKIGDYYFEQKSGKDHHLAVWMIVLACISSFVPFVGFAATIVLLILEYVCMYQFYAAVCEKHPVSCLVWSILVRILRAVFLFVLKGREDVNIKKN